MQLVKQYIVSDYSYLKSHWYSSCGEEAAHRTAAAVTCPKLATGEIGTAKAATGSTHAGADDIKSH